MGFIRGSAFVIVSVLLFISIFCMGFFYMVSQSLEYDVLKSELVSGADEAIREMGVYDNFIGQFSMIQSACEQIGFYTFKIDYGSLDIDCENLSDDAEEAYYNTLSNFVMSSYYDDYDCSLLQCWEETKNPNFLLSSKTHNYASSKFYFFILIGFVLSGLMFVIIEKRSTLPIVIGAMFVLISLVFMKLDSLVAFIDDKLILNFISIFLTSTYKTFVRFMSVGVGVITIGIVLKLFLVGFKIQSLVKWFKEKSRKGKIKKLEESIKKNKKILSKKSAKKNKKGAVSVDLEEEE